MSCSYTQKMQRFILFVNLQASIRRKVTMSKSLSLVYENPLEYTAKS